ncbi:MAG: tRNA pseudouridine(38-40) synthase, partial [uncultured Sphingomonas sp.]
DALEADRGMGWRSVLGLAAAGSWPNGPSCARTRRRSDDRGKRHRSRRRPDRCWGARA